MATINLYKGEYEGTLVSYNLVDIDLEDVALETEITTPWVINGTYPATGDDIKFCSFEIGSPGIHRISNYATDPASNQNLGEQPRISVEYISATDSWEIDLLPYSELVQVGQQPENWSFHWLDQYYTQTPYTEGNQTYDTYLATSSVWDPTAYYYKDTRQQTIYYNGSAGFFGVSRVFALHYQPGYGQVLTEDTNVGFRIGWTGSSTDMQDSYFRWKSGGAFGQALFSNQYASALCINDRGPVYDSLTAPGEFGGHTLVQMCQFTWNDTHYKGAIVMRVTIENILQSAKVVAISDPFWTPIQRNINDGPASTTKGGYGTFTAPSNNRGDASGSGIRSMVSAWNSELGSAYTHYSKYRISSSYAMAEFAGRLFSPSTLEALQNMFYNPKDAIMTYHMMPSSIAPATHGNASNISAANVPIVERTTPTFADVFTHKHVGDVHVEVYSDSFADWDNTSIYIHLPYVGTYPIDTAAVMNGHIAVEYVTDVMSGNINAIIWTQDCFGNHTYRYEFKGNCAAEIPLMYREATAKQQAVIGVAKTAVATLVGYAIGNATGAIMGAFSGATSHLANYYGTTGTLKGAFNGGFSGSGIGDAMKDQASVLGKVMSKTGIGYGLNAAAGLTATSAEGVTNTSAHGGVVTTPLDTQCYLLITRPQWSAPEGYAHQFGYPSDIGGTINSVGFSDFLMVRSIDLSGVDATDQEKTEINNLMFAGIYV